MKNLEMYCVTNKTINFLHDTNYKIGWVGQEKPPQNYISCDNGDNIFFKEKNSVNLKFFKTIFLISLLLFITKNTLRIYRSDTELFPKTVVDENIQNFNKVNDDGGLQLLTVKDGICYYTKLICSHEIPKDIQINKIGNYYILME